MFTKMDRNNRISHAAEVFRRLGVFQDDVAGVVGTSQAQISRILAGKIQRWTRLSEEVCLYAERLEGGVTEVLPLNSATGNLVKSVFEKENGLEEAVFRRADHRIFEAGGSRSAVEVSAIAENDFEHAAYIT